MEEVVQQYLQKAKHGNAEEVILFGRRATKALDPRHLMFDVAARTVTPVIVDVVGEVLSYAGGQQSSH